VFVNRYLRRILNIYWPETISNEELRKRAKEDSIKNQILRRKWNWKSHTLRKTEMSIERQALDWNPQGTRKKEDDENSHGDKLQRRKNGKEKRDGRGLRGSQLTE
jgi:hypothetical protein